MTTIDAATAEILAFTNDDETENGWTRITRQVGYKSRWSQGYTLILRDADGATWGLDYEAGATEEQENDYPWLGLSDDEQILLTRMYPHPSVVYKTEPAEVTA
jgi:hypothetical protein